MSELRAACHRRDIEHLGWPTVSVVVPVRNEGPHLQAAIASIVEQDYPLPFEVCLAVAPSTDDTAATAAALSAAHERVSVVDNPAGVTPAGLNAAIAATSGSIIVRVDGHAALSDGYITRAVETMCRTGAVNVGGIQAARGETPFEHAVADAMTSWMGTGGSRFHVGGVGGAVDTVYLGVFDRAAGDLVGWFDESLIRNQDYEFNIRLRAAGGTVWFDPELSASYRPRGTLKALAKQYYEYGTWKAEVATLHPASLRPRQLVPVAVTALLCASLLASVRRPVRIVPAIAYAVVCAIAMSGSRGRRPSDARSWMILPVMHQSWGVGFLVRAASMLTRSVVDRRG